MSATPTLNLKQDFPLAPRKWKTNALSFCFGGSLALIAILGEEGIIWRSLVPLDILYFLPAMLFAIAVHETGHAMAGAAVGLKFGGMAVGPLTLVKQTDGWGLRWNKSSGWGGFYKPLMTYSEFRPQAAAIMVACGPLANLILSLLLAAFAPMRGRTTISEWWAVLFWVSAAMFIVNSIPFATRTNRSDGGRFLQLTTKPAEAHSWIAMVELQTQDDRGVRPREWEQAMFKAVMRFGPDAPEYARCQWLAFYRKLDCGELDAALVHLDCALQRSRRSGLFVRSLLCQEAAFVSAVLLGRAEQARAWRERALRLRKQKSLAAVDAGIALAEGRYEDALRWFGIARGAIAKLKIQSGMLNFALDRWSVYEERCRAALGQAGLNQAALHQADARADTRS